MRLGYNTNGFAHHRLRDTLSILSRIGYRSVALTLEQDQLDPPDPRGVLRCVDQLKPLIEESGLDVTVETGSRFILDPYRKHQPTLLSGSAGRRQQRVEFLKAAIAVADALGAQSVSLWSGQGDDHAQENELFDRLASTLGELLRDAQAVDMRLSFEPEPGMFIDTMGRFEHLYGALHHRLFGLTLDIGHLYCLEEGDVTQHIKRWSHALWNVHIEDMKPRVHEHLMFGEGEVDFSAVFQALCSIDYRGPVHVELSRHSHNAVEVAGQAYEFLRRYIQGA